MSFTDDCLEREDEAPLITIATVCTACGTSWTLPAWIMLPLIGIQHTDDPNVSLELRLCTCGSTRAARIPDLRSGK